VELREAIEGPLAEIINGIQTVLDETPPELVADIMESGIHLAGGGSKLMGIRERITSDTAIRTVLVKNPEYVVVRGSGYSLEELDALRSVLHNPVPE